MTLTPRDRYTVTGRGTVLLFHREQLPMPVTELQGKTLDIEGEPMTVVSVELERCLVFGHDHSEGWCSHFPSIGLVVKKAEGASLAAEASDRPSVESMT